VPIVSSVQEASAALVAIIVARQAATASVLPSPETSFFSLSVVVLRTGSLFFIISVINTDDNDIDLYLTDKKFICQPQFYKLIGVGGNINIIR